jgi:hypothetical protein
LHDEEMKKRLRYDWKIAAGVCQGVELDVTVEWRGTKEHVELRNSSCGFEMRGRIIGNLQREQGMVE